TAPTTPASTTPPTRMRLPRRSSAVSATLASRTKPTIPTTSRRYSNRNSSGINGGEKFSPLFFLTSVLDRIQQARNYEAPTPHLRIASASALDRVGPSCLPCPDGHREHDRRSGVGPTNIGTSGERQGGSSRERCRAH